MKPIKTWILIADSSRARIVENTGPGRGLHPLAKMSWTAPQPSEFEDDPGRSFGSAGSMRHKMEPHQGNGERSDVFARALFTDLARLKRARRFDRLILCAPPAMLGSLRKHLPDQLRSDVTAEIAKDLVQISPAKLPGHFSHVLAV